MISSKCKSCGADVFYEQWAANATCEFCQISFPVEATMPPPPPSSGMPAPPQRQTSFIQPPNPMAPPPAINYDGKGLSIASLIIGIVSIVFVLGIPLGIAGLILGVVGAKKAKAAGASPSTATAGIVTSVISIVFAIIIFAACGAMLLNMDAITSLLGIEV
jgi:hypothetical protein